MPRHFRLTLNLSPDDLLILTAFVEHTYDRASAGPYPIPRPLGRRLRQLAHEDPTDMAFEHLVTREDLDWDITEVGADTVSIATRPRGASLAQTIELLGRLTPSCLEGRIIYEPIEPAQGTAAGAALN